MRKCVARIQPLLVFTQALVPLLAGIRGFVPMGKFVLRFSVDTIFPLVNHVGGATHHLPFLCPPLCEGEKREKCGPNKNYGPFA
jgi:hypothetical protein